jgi:hypothetical protein
LVYAVLLGLLCLVILWIGAPAGLRPRVLLLAGVVGAVTFAFGALGLFLSAVFENRWGALALSVAAMLVFFLLPLTVLFDYERGKPAPWGSALYLTPFIGAAELSHAVSEQEFRRDLPPVLLGRTPFYVITPVLYAGLGVLLTGAAGMVHAARQRQRSSAPVA